MSDEKTREVPLTDVMGIAEVSDEPTETLPAVDDPGEAKTESFQKPFDGGPEAQRKFESQDEAESLETSGQDMRGSFAGRSARPTGSVKSADPAKSAEPVDPSKQVRIGKTDGELVIRPSGPSTGTIVLGVFFCLIGLMSNAVPAAHRRMAVDAESLDAVLLRGRRSRRAAAHHFRGLGRRRRGASAPTGTPVSRTVPRKPAAPTIAPPTPPHTWPR